MTQQTPPPVSGLAGILSIVQSVVNLVPRWLIVSAGLVFVAWLGFDLYLNARQKLAETERIEGESKASAAMAKGWVRPSVEETMPKVTPSPAIATGLPKSPTADCETGVYHADGTCDRTRLPIKADGTCPSGRVMQEGACVRAWKSN